MSHRLERSESKREVQPLGMDLLGTAKRRAYCSLKYAAD